MDDTRRDRLLARYRGCTATIVSDALDEHGIDGVITGLTPAHPEQTAVGFARPVGFEPAPADAERTNFPFEMFRAFAPDELLVIDGGPPELSCWGGLASALAAREGVAGTVVDGGYRDYADVRESDYPVFGAARTPRTGQGRLRVATTDEPVRIDGVAVAPGDVVVADGTGIAVVPGDRAAAVAETAEGILGREHVLDRKVANGLDLDALTDEYEGF